MAKLYFKVLKWAISLLIIFFLVRYLFQNFNKIDWSLVSFDPFYLILASLVSILAFLLMAFLWWYLLKRMNKSIGLFSAFKIYFASQLGRYVPGKALLLITRVYMAEKKGLDRKVAFSSVVLDLALFCFSAVLIFLFSLPLFNNLGNQIVLIAVGLGIILLPFVHPKVLKYIINKGLRLIGKEEVRFRLSFSDSLLLLIFHILRWVVQGLGMYFLIKSFFPVEFALIYIMPAVFAISIVMGMAMLLAPSGLGVREGLIVLFLSSFVSVELAVLFSLLSRIFLTLIEAGLALFFILIKKD